MLKKIFSFFLLCIMASSLARAMDSAEFIFDKKRDRFVFDRPESLAKTSAKTQFKLWDLVYREEFGVKINPRMKIPTRVKGYDRLIVVAKGMDWRKIYAVVGKRMTGFMMADSYFNVYKAGIKSDRIATTDYAVWVKDSTEAEERFANKSYDDLKKENVRSITIEEYLLLAYIKVADRGEHIDQKGWTMCAGSKDVSVSGKYPFIPTMKYNWYMKSLEFRLSLNEDGKYNRRTRDVVF